jgi:hypothetical protein
MSRGTCDWCEQEVGDDELIVDYPDGDDTVTHFGFCLYKGVGVAQYFAAEASAS